MKYEKPRLIDISEFSVAVGQCQDGSTNVEQCGGGANVIPNCNSGGLPTTECIVGDSDDF